MTFPWAYLGLLSAAFVAGAIPTGLLAMRKAIADRSEANESAVLAMRRNLVVPAVFFLPIAGALADSWGPRDVALLGVFAAVVGLALVAMIPQATNATMNMIGVSFGLSLLAVGTITWMPLGLVPAPEPGSPARDVEAMNLGFAALGLGWLVGPTLADATVRWGGASRALFFQAAALLVVFGLLALASTGTINEIVDAAAEVAKEAPALVPEPAGNIAIDLRFWALGLVLLLYLPIAGAIDIWSRPFVRELADQGEPAVELRLRLFWLAFLAARVYSFWAMRSGLEAWVLVACAAGVVIVLGNLAGVQQLSTGTWGFVIIGFFYGPLLPGIFGLVHSNLSHSGLILGSALGVATLWHLLVDPALARGLQPWSPRQTMRLSMVASLALCATLLLVALMQPEPVTVPRPVQEVAKKDRFEKFRTFFRKLLVKQKS